MKIITVNPYFKSQRIKDIESCGLELKAFLLLGFDAEYTGQEIVANVPSIVDLLPLTEGEQELLANTAGAKIERREV